MWREAYTGSTCHFQDHQRIAVRLSASEILNLPEDSLDFIMNSGIRNVYLQFDDSTVKVLGKSLCPPSLSSATRMKSLALSTDSFELQDL